MNNTSDNDEKSDTEFINSSSISYEFFKNVPEMIIGVDKKLTDIKI